MCVLVSQSCPTICDAMDYSPPGSSVHGIFQTRILEWVAIPFSRGSSQPRDQTWVSCIAGSFFTVWAMREASSISLSFLETFIIWLKSLLPGLHCGIWTLSCSMQDLIPWSGIKPRPPALGTQSLSPWTTREVPIFFLTCIYSFIYFWLCRVLVAARRIFLLRACLAVVVCRLSCPVASGILVPGPRIKLMSCALVGRFLTTGPPGKSIFPFL